MQSLKEEIKKLLERYKQTGHDNIPGAPMRITDDNIDSLTAFMMKDDKTDSDREKFLNGLRLIVQRTEQIQSS